MDFGIPPGLSGVIGKTRVPPLGVLGLINKRILRMDSNRSSRAILLVFKREAPHPRIDVTLNSSLVNGAEE